MISNTFDDDSIIDETFASQYCGCYICVGQHIFGMSKAFKGQIYFYKNQFLDNLQFYGIISLLR